MQQFDSWETEDLKERIVRIDEELSHLNGLLDNLYQIDTPIDIKPVILDGHFKERLLSHLKRQREQEFVERQQLKQEYIASWHGWTKDRVDDEYEQATAQPVHASILENSKALTSTTQRWMSTLATASEQRKPFPVGYLNTNGRLSEPVYPVGHFEPLIGVGNVSVGGCVWTVEEQQAFVDRYVQHPKQFHRIASSLPNKSCSDCVLFYYRFKKPLRLKQRALAYRKTGSSGGNLSNSGSSLFDSNSIKQRSKPARRGRPPKSRQQESTAEEEDDGEGEDTERDEGPMEDIRSAEVAQEVALKAEIKAEAKFEMKDDLQTDL